MGGDIPPLYHIPSKHAHKHFTLLLPPKYKSHVYVLSQHFGSTSAAKKNWKHTYPLDILVIWLRFHIWFQLLLFIAHVHPFVFHYVLEKKKTFKFQKPKHILHTVLKSPSMVWQSLCMLNCVLQKLQSLIKPKPGPQKKLWVRRKPVYTYLNATQVPNASLNTTYTHTTRHSTVIIWKLDNLC